MGFRGDYEPSDTASLASSIDFPTPTHSTASNTTTMGDANKIEEVSPWPGETYIIREKSTHATLILARGQLEVAQDGSHRDGYHWECVEKAGWLGFRNSVSGTYIGRDSRGGYIASAPHHKQFEYFCARRHPDGGYVLMTRQHEDDTLLQMTIRDGDSLVETKGEGTKWEFIRAADIDF